jgi:hypothetical protein
MTHTPSLAALAAAEHRRSRGAPVAWLLSWLLVCAAGCADNKKILSPNIERTPVVFESPAAAEAFEDELEDRYDGGEADVQQNSRYSLNAFFNQQIRKADRDNDGIITEVEAQRYAK